MLHEHLPPLSSKPSKPTHSTCTVALETRREWDQTDHPFETLEPLKFLRILDDLYLYLYKYTKEGLYKYVSKYVRTL